MPSPTCLALQAASLLNNSASFFLLMSVVAAALLVFLAIEPRSYARVRAPRYRRRARQKELALK